MREEFINDGEAKSVERGELTVNDPVLLITSWDATEFTLREKGDFFRSSCWGNVLRASIAKVALVPLYPNCFGMCSDVLVKGSGYFRSKCN